IKCYASLLPQKLAWIIEGDGGMQSRQPALMPRPVALPAARTMAREKPRLPGRNDLCICGSMSKWKHCHGAAV
ncbi:MAG TPA: SEC-C metal-binding domain-containing protein, partial [Kofleriaceae bacterium]|nr:SEC-C metal-binding domain-containing protein [Kofleriaceae bacterium]